MTPTLAPKTPKPTFQSRLRSSAKTMIRGFLIAALLIGANIAATIIWEMYNPSPRLVMIDINGIVRGFIAETAKSDLSDELKRARTETFARQLDTALEGLSVAQQTIILSAPAVIAGVEDITDAVMEGFKK